MGLCASRGCKSGGAGSLQQLLQPGTSNQNTGAHGTWHPLLQFSERGLPTTDTIKYSISFTFFLNKYYNWTKKLALPSVPTATEDFVVRTHTTLRRCQGMVLTHSSGFTTTVLPLTVPGLQFFLLLDIQPSLCLHFSPSLQRQMNAHKASKASR